MIGRRFVESEAYKGARAGFAEGEIADELRSVEVLSEPELRDALKLRTSSGLASFDIEGEPFVAELPAVARVPSVVETIPVEKEQVELASETSETTLATSVKLGTPYPEAAMNFGASPTLQLLPRFGTSVPATLGILDEPGQIASLLDRRLSLGVGLGLENDILNGNNDWTGAITLASSGPEAEGADDRVIALRKGVSLVQDAGWYIRPLQVVIHPDTAGAMFEQEDGSQRPLPVLEMFVDQVDTWIITNQIAAGKALVGDFFEAIGLFVKGPLTVQTAANHEDFFTRGMVEMTVGFRCYSWVRNPTALCLVTGIA